jgi:hypothetical protein
VHLFYHRDGDEEEDAPPNLDGPRDHDVADALPVHNRLALQVGVKVRFYSTRLSFHETKMSTAEYNSLKVLVDKSVWGKVVGAARGAWKVQWFLKLVELNVEKKTFSTADLYTLRAHEYEACIV